MWNVKMWDYKKIRTIVLLLTLTISLGLLISPYMKTQHPLVSLTVSTTADVNKFQILRGDDDDGSQVAKVVVDAPEVAEVGELIRFNLSESVAQSFKWLMIPATTDFEIYYDGRYAVFSARKPGDYIFIIGCAYNDTVDVVVHTVTVEGVIDPVVPDDVYPDVAKPDANANLNQWGPYWCSINKRPKRETEKLAGCFEGIAAQIAAGTLQKATDISKATAEANREALDNSLPDWLPVLREFQIVMKTLAEQGKLSTPEQHRVLWLEIAKGLRYYASLFN